MEHKSISLADQVFERLEKDILTGVYARGEVLNEMKLVADLGVSRTPVREAVKRLEQESLVELSGKGITVIGVSNQDLLDIFALRLRIEGLVAAETAKNITDEELKELKEAVDLQSYYVEKHDAEHIKYMDSRFHQLIYRFCGSRIYYDTLLPLHKKVQKFRRASVENRSRASSSVSEHQAIYDAIAAHDEKRAEEAMITHIKNAQKHVTEGNQ